jgi:hypothetical protein
MRVAAILFALGLPALAQGQKGALQFETLEHDFGVIRDEKPVTFGFKFTNASKDRTVTIQNIQTTCGCTTPALEKKTYAPGEGSQIDVTFNPLNRFGRERKVITLETNDPEAPRIEIAVLSQVLPRILIEPVTMFLGEVRFDNVVGTVRPMRLQISSRIPDFQVKSARVLDERFTFRELRKEDVKSPEGEKLIRWIWELSLEQNVPVGNVQTIVLIETNDAARARIEIPVYLFSVGDLRLMPDRLYASTSGPGESFSVELVVSSRDGTAFQLLEATVVPDPSMKEAEQLGFTAEKEYLHQGSWRVRFRGKSPAMGAPFSGTIRLKTDTPAQPTVDVPFNGLVLAPVAPPPATPTAPQK